MTAEEANVCPGRVTGEEEASVCEREAPDGTPYAAFLTGPDEIALRLPGPSDRWLLLTVNSGRLDDAVQAVLTLRSADRRIGRMADLVRDRLDAWLPERIGQGAGPSAKAVWAMFKHQVLAELATLRAGQTHLAARDDHRSGER